MRKQNLLTRRSLCAAMAAAFPGRAKTGASLVVCAGKQNDVVQALRAADLPVRRYDTPADAVKAAETGSAVLLLPGTPWTLEKELAGAAKEKQLRVYGELCSWHAASPPARKIEWERAIVTSDFFGRERRSTILSLHRSSYIPVESAVSVHLKIGRVAGFNTAVFGIPANALPLLYEPEPGFMVSAAMLSQFVTGRYAPFDSWESVWVRILHWMGDQPARIRLQPRVRPAYSRNDPLPPDAEIQAAERGANWYRRARLLVHPSWQAKVQQAGQFPDRIGPAPRSNWPVGDGTLGIIEGHASEILPDGSQNARWWVRADCVGEAAMTLALVERNSKTSRNLVDYLFGRTKMSLGDRADPQSAAYGLLGWNETDKYFQDQDGFGVYYGDDNARCLLGAIASEALNRRTQWQRRIWEAVLANFRLTGRLGHREWRHDQKPLSEKG